MSDKQTTREWWGSNLPRWMLRIMFSGAIYSLWGPLDLKLRKRWSGKST